MKKHVVFLSIFLLLFSLTILLVQTLTGVFLTSTYTPDIDEAWKASATLHREIEIFASSSSVWFILLSVTLSAIIAYFISQKVTKRAYNRVG